MTAFVGREAVVRRETRARVGKKRRNRGERGEEEVEKKRAATSDERS